MMLQSTLTSEIILENYAFVFIQISLLFVSKGHLGETENKSSLVQVIACWLTGDKSLPEPMMTKFFDAVWHH